MYSVGEFAKLINKSVRTLQRWDTQNVLKANRTTSDRRYYTEQQLQQYKGLSSNDNSINIAYCRVSNRNQTDDLKNQKDYISIFSLNAGINIDEWFVDIGSGLNFKRKNFNKLINLVEHGKIKTIIIAHKDRLVRFGYEWFEQFCINHGVKILLINNDELSPEQELVQDLISIIHVFSCRIYGLRKYKKKLMEDVEL
jgi:predicted site-specific integrase-resolvase